jgi:hypothetical protein
MNSDEFWISEVCIRSPEYLKKMVSEVSGMTDFKRSDGGIIKQAKARDKKSAKVR